MMHGTDESGGTAGTRAMRAALASVTGGRG